MNNPRLIVGVEPFPVLKFEGRKFLFDVETDYIIDALLKPGVYAVRASKAPGFRKIAEAIEDQSGEIAYQTDAGEAWLCEGALRVIFGEAPEAIYVRRLR